MKIVGYFQETQLFHTISLYSLPIFFFAFGIHGLWVTPHQTAIITQPYRSRTNHEKGEGESYMEAAGNNIKM
jgi:hypothetical protein